MYSNSHSQRLSYLLVFSLLLHGAILIDWSTIRSRAKPPPPPLPAATQLRASLSNKVKSYQQAKGPLALNRGVNKVRQTAPKPKLIPMPLVDTTTVIHIQPMDDITNPLAAQTLSEDLIDLASGVTKNKTNWGSEKSDRPQSELHSAMEDSSHTAETQAHQLPSQIDLVFNGYRGKNSFWVGQGTFRLTQNENKYELSTVGEAKGILALFYWGQFRQWSRGIISNEGVRPLEYTTETAGSNQTEKASVDWEHSLVTLRNGEQAPFEGPLQDQLSFLLQFYFTPPTTKRYEFTMLSPRKLERFVFAEVGTETLAMEWGAVVTQHWQRLNDAGDRIDLWLAPEYRLMPVKVRYANKNASKVNELRLIGVLIDEYNPLTKKEETSERWLKRVQHAPLGASGSSEKTTSADQP